MSLNLVAVLYNKLFRQGAIQRGNPAKDILGQPLGRISGTNGPASFKVEFMTKLQNCCVLK